MMMRRTLGFGLVLALGAAGACSSTSGTETNPATTNDAGSDVSLTPADAGSDSSAPTDAAGDADATTKHEWKVAISGLERGFFNIWGSSASDIWAEATAEPTTPGVMRYNGTAWTVYSNGPNWLGPFTGTSANDVWALNTELDSMMTPTFKPAHFNGTTWSLSAALPGYIYKMWAASANDVWGVGADGLIAHYNGTSWTTTTHGTKDLVGIAGVSATDIWAIGSGGTILHYNGTAWSSIATGTTQNFRSVWASSANDIWVGTTLTEPAAEGEPPVAGPTFLHSTNGTTFAPVGAPGLVVINGFWGAAPNDLWAVGNAEPPTTGASMPMTKFFHYDGTNWTDVPPPAGITGHYVTAIWGSSATNIWAVGYDYMVATGGIIFHYE